MTSSSIADLMRKAPAGRKGHRLTVEARKALKDAFGDLCPDWYLQVLSEAPLMGTIYQYTQPGSSNRIVEWTSASVVLQEALDAIPGTVALRQGYIPVGSCPEGSGDPYFVKFLDGATPALDPPLIQIFHDQVAKDRPINATAFRAIAPTLSDFFRHVSVLA